MRKLILIALLLPGISGMAQRIDPRKEGLNMMAGSLFYSGVNGEPITASKYTKLINGSPYFNDDWMKGIVVMPNGDAYKNVDAKIDLLEGALLFRNTKGVEMLVKTALKEVILSDSSEEHLYRFVAAEALPFQAPKKGWYLWLHSGNVALYKHFGKQLAVKKPYGSATEEQRIFTRPVYFIVQDGKATEVKKLKDVPDILQDKRSELEAFLKSLAADASDDDRFTEVISYYNTLLQ